MASTKTYTLTQEGTYTAQALDSTGTYESSETSDPVSNAARMVISNNKFVVSSGKFVRVAAE